MLKLRNSLLFIVFIATSGLLTPAGFGYFVVDSSDSQLALLHMGEDMTTYYYCGRLNPLVKEPAASLTRALELCKAQASQNPFPVPTASYQSSFLALAGFESADLPANPRNLAMELAIANENLYRTTESEVVSDPRLKVLSSLESGIFQPMKNPLKGSYAQDVETVRPYISRLVLAFTPTFNYENHRLKKGKEVTAARLDESCEALWAPMGLQAFYKLSTRGETVRSLLKWLSREYTSARHVTTYAMFLAWHYWLEPVTIGGNSGYTHHKFNYVFQLGSDSVAWGSRQEERVLGLLNGPELVKTSLLGSSSMAFVSNVTPNQTYSPLCVRSDFEAASTLDESAKRYTLADLLARYKTTKGELVRIMNLHPAMEHALSPALVGSPVSAQAAEKFLDSYFAYGHKTDRELASDRDAREAQAERDRLAKLKREKEERDRQAELARIAQLKREQEERDRAQPKTFEQRVASIEATQRSIAAQQSTGRLVSTLRGVNDSRPGPVLNDRQVLSEQLRDGQNAKVCLWGNTSTANISTAGDYHAISTQRTRDCMAIAKRTFSNCEIRIDKLMQYKFWLKCPDTGNVDRLQSLKNLSCTDFARKSTCYEFDSNT